MEEELITHLTEEWDKEIYPCYFSCGEGASIAAKQVLTKLVDQCCNIFNKARGTSLGTKLYGTFCNPEKLIANSLFIIIDNGKETYLTNLIIKLPKSSEFNRNPEAFYKNIMDQLGNYLKIKATMPK